ncbi:MAG: hypothetical protein MSS85_04260 [Pyramidobacter sp.]|nr:hypothetical protein [Pyramidobacter sp.]
MAAGLSARAVMQIHFSELKFSPPDKDKLGKIEDLEELICEDQKIMQGSNLR